MLGNLLIVGLTTKDKKILTKLVKECHVGGVTLYSRLYKNYEEMLELINYLKKLSKEANYELLICIDQEGYRVNRLPNDFLNIKSPYSLKDDSDNAQENAHIVGTILNKSGINVNFAPVLDIKRFKDNHPIGDRTFGDNPEEITINTTKYINELRNNHVIPVVKHFPGHGATTINTHHFLPVILNTKRLFKEDIIPFKEAIKNNIEVIMVGHFLIKNICLFKPSSFSKNIVKLLRDDLNYQNIIMTDDLNMGLLKLFNKTRLIKKGINNGFNLFMIKYYDNFFKDYQKLLKYEQNNKLNKENINKSLQLLNDLKLKYNVNNNEVQNTLDINNINNKIKNLNNKAKITK